MDRQEMIEAKNKAYEEYQEFSHIAEWVFFHTVETTAFKTLMFHRATACFRNHLDWLRLLKETF